jgi:hypothetical protein
MAVATLMNNTRNRVYLDGSGGHAIAVVQEDQNGNPLNPAAPVLGAGTNVIGGVTLNNLQAAPINLFELVVATTLGATQSALFFPTTIAITGGLPAIGSGAVANLTNVGAVCGGVFAPDPRWDSVLLEFAEVGGADDTTVVIEIGRLKAAGAVPEVLASVTLTAGAVTLAGNSLNPFTGLAHSNVTWRFFDNATLAANLSGLGDVLLANGGGVVDGEKPTLVLAVHDAAYYYCQVTAQASGTMTNILCTMTPKS